MTPSVAPSAPFRPRIAALVCDWYAFSTKSEQQASYIR